MMSLTFGLFSQVSGSGPLGPLVYFYLFYVYLSLRYCVFVSIGFCGLFLNEGLLSKARICSFGANSFF